MKSRGFYLISSFILFFAFVMTAQAQDTSASSKRTVSVSGEGTVTVEPDRATVRFGVVSRADTPEAARKQNAEAASAAMNAVRDLGIPEEDISMERLQLQPWREYNREKRQYEEKGYEATRQVRVVVDQLDQLPTLVTRVVQKGANRLQGINYELQDRKAVRNDALRAAAQNAREKAQLLAETLGAQLGPVRSISEQSFSIPPMRVEMARATTMAKSDAEPEPDAYAAGEMEVDATVQVTFDLMTGE